MRCGRAVASAFATWMLATGPALSFAAEEAHGGHGASHGIPWGTLLFSSVNFAIFVYVIIVRGLLPSFRRWAGERRDRVIRELEEARRARSEAERLHAEWETRWASLEAEMGEIRRQVEQDAARERDRILQTARETAATIEADARRTAAQEVIRAEGMVREEVARRAVAIAERLIQEQLTADDQQRFVDDFLKQVGA